MGDGQQIALIAGMFSVAVALIQAWVPQAKKVAALESMVARLRALVFKLGGNPDDA